VETKTAQEALKMAKKILKQGKKLKKTRTLAKPTDAYLY